MIPNILSIAGSHPSGGAGIQADLKAISANGGFAMAALTALTAQNTQGVSGVHLVPSDFVQAQIKAVFDDVRVDAVKVGMIANAKIAHAVTDALAPFDVPIVVDPVMIAKGGAPLLEDEAIEALRRKLLPIARLITPNLPEGARLLDAPVPTTREEIEAQAHDLLRLGPDAVLLKGGHLSGEDSPDCLATSIGTEWFESPRHHTKNTHGTGCTLSAALATQIGKGAPLSEAVQRAKVYVTSAIRSADDLDVGSGHGPTHHFATLWSSAKDL